MKSNALLSETIPHFLFHPDSVKLTEVFYLYDDVIVAHKNPLVEMCGIDHGS